MKADRTVSASRDEGGFLLLVMLAVIGSSSLFVLAAVSALLPDVRAGDSEFRERAGAVAREAEQVYWLSGAFPPSLDQLAAASGKQADGYWRRDPRGRGLDLDYRVVSGDVIVRGRGLDGRLNSGDDQTESVGPDRALRRRQRARLRVLRAVLLRSSYRDAASMTAAERTEMRNAQHTFARIRRVWWGASAATRGVLSAELSIAEATVQNLVATHALPAMPASAAGAGGLAQALGVADSRVLDGRGAVLELDPTFGWFAAGADGMGGTDDDM